MALDRLPKPGEGWRHHKGQLYFIVCVAADDGTGAARVIYYAASERGLPAPQRTYFDRLLSDFLGLAPRDEARCYGQHRFEYERSGPEPE